MTPSANDATLSQDAIVGIDGSIWFQLGGQIYCNGHADATTSNAKSLLYSGGRVYHTNGTGWYSKAVPADVWRNDPGKPASGAVPAPAAPPVVAPVPQPKPPVVPPGGGSGAFRVANGRFIAPDGSDFHAKGVNLTPWPGDDGSNFPHIAAMYPGINFVRLVMSVGCDMSAITPFIDAATKAKVVCMIDNHTLNSINTGQGLIDEADWYRGLAGQYKANPYVWFNSQNEPDGGVDGPTMAAEHASVYDAIRGTGSKAILLLSNPGGGYTDWNRGQDATYAKMTNVGWSIHYYGYLTGNYGFGPEDADPAHVAAALAAECSAAQRIKSADGLMPCLIDEFGPSTSGDAGSIDANGWQVVDTVLNGPWGFCAWAHNGTGTPDGDALTNDEWTLTEYGRRVAARMAK